MSSSTPNEPTLVANPLPQLTLEPQPASQEPQQSQQAQQPQTTQQQSISNPPTQSLTSPSAENPNPSTDTPTPKDLDDSLSDQPQDSNAEESTEYFTRDLIELSRSTVTFNKGTLFPGSIEQLELTIKLKDEVLPDEDPKAAYLLRVVAICNNSEFNELDQYVYSVRSNDRFEYFEEVRFRIKKKERAQVRVAVKIPEVRAPYEIEGTLSIQLENTVPIFLPISSKCEIPKITCMKDLFQINQQTHMIKIPAKKNVKIPLVPFKNLSPFGFILEAQTATTQDFSNRPYDIVSQSIVNCNANMPFFVNLQIKSNPNYRGPIPKTDTLRKILIFKVKNSTVFFSYPLEVFVFESSVASSAS